MANKHLTKQQRDNRANQMNPNNPAYYKSRQGNQKSNKSHTHTNTIVRTEVVHHHHYRTTSLFDLIFG